MPLPQYISLSDAAFRLRRPMRQLTDWLFSGRLRGEQYGKSWRRVDLASVQQLEKELGLVVENDPMDGNKAA
jgi:hypothetical protein